MRGNSQPSVRYQLQMSSQSRHPSICDFVRVLELEQVEPVDEATAQAAAAKHASLHADTVGVDAPADTDLFYRLQIDRCFFVRGLGSIGQAEIISGEVCPR